MIIPLRLPFHRHAGLDPESLAAWTPDQVRGDDVWEVVV